MSRMVQTLLLWPCVCRAPGHRVRCLSRQLLGSLGTTAYTASLSRILITMERPIWTLWIKSLLLSLLDHVIDMSTPSLSLALGPRLRISPSGPTSHRTTSVGLSCKYLGTLGDVFLLSVPMVSSLVSSLTASAPKPRLLNSQA
ncbi:uncharacterized protein B0H18DRAFT_616389 [Fomitopsis serialis]|uniref:uncharacterized protein n=1 Tax=Fomitopsis serialis TaxID=139415 RepID=UPI002008A9D1|nr:uncharacterized protein B0H18DRAFT_616389 [Neoantrodia serialis]KAH9920053.1 hypothetical protein B0H18DRAFT_616389 [Neoantrodia serialis]